MESGRLRLANFGRIFFIIRVDPEHALFCRKFIKLLVRQRSGQDDPADAVEKRDSVNRQQANRAEERPDYRKFQEPNYRGGCQYRDSEPPETEVDRNSLFADSAGQEEPQGYQHADAASHAAIFIGEDEFRVRHFIAWIAHKYLEICRRSRLRQ
jgi:hypothetical protein